MTTKAKHAASGPNIHPITIARIIRFISSMVPAREPDLTAEVESVNSEQASISGRRNATSIV